MKLLAGYGKRLKKQGKPAAKPVKLNPVLPKSTAYYAKRISMVDTVEGAKDLVDFAYQRHLSHIGIDTEFGYEGPPLTVHRKETVYDPTTVKPLLLQLALAEPDDQGGGTLYRFVVDVRTQKVAKDLEPLFDLPVPFVGHFLKAEYICLLKLGLPLPRVVWDTWVHEKVMVLGHFRNKDKLPKDADDAEQARAREQGEEIKRGHLSLLSTCRRHGVPHAFAQDKERLQQSFLNHPDDQPFSQEQVEYAAEDAVVAAKLYPLQVVAAISAGLLEHHIQIEMPWTKVTASMEWTGVWVDRDKLQRLAEGCEIKLDDAMGELKKYGIDSVKSHPQMANFFQEVGLLGKFQKGKGYSFDDTSLKRHQGDHPAISLIRQARKLRGYISDPLVQGELVCTDGRVRTQQRQLGTDSGRQSTRLPNLQGLEAKLRPLVVPKPGHGIGEADWSQIEVGLSAAIYRDPDLLEMFNTGDVYSAMAQKFFADQFTSEDLELSSREFKAKHKDLRNHMKTCTLALIYGTTAYGLARQLDISKHKADSILRRFKGMFPALMANQHQQRQLSAIRGYAMSITGLKRHRIRRGVADWRERNWLINHPVQSTGADIFKVAGIRLDKLYPQYGARLIIPLHDAFIFEAPLERLEAVAKLTERIMVDVVKEYFPQLRPRVELNISRPECWNKDGQADSLDQWLAVKPG